MLRSCALAVAMLLALPALAWAQTVATSDTAPASCAAQPGTSGTTPAETSSPGSAPGETEIAADQPAVSSTDPADTASEGADGSISGDVPLTTVAQEPEPEPDPEGPGEEQPGEPGGEPQTPSGEEAPDTGGGLPQTGLEALKLALLGLLLVLVGARIRAVVKRRRAPARLAPDGLPYGTPEVSESSAAPEEQAEYDEEQPEDDDETREYAEVTGGRRDEWSFPDPDERAPTGLLPSTATARREARRREDERPR